MLEVSSWKDVVHFGKKEMLAPRYEYWTDANMHVPLERIKVHKTLRFVEEPVKIIDREVKSLKPSRISIVKVCWNSKRGYEDFMKTKYPHLLYVMCCMLYDVIVLRLLCGQEVSPTLCGYEPVRIRYQESGFGDNILLHDYFCDLDQGTRSVPVMIACLGRLHVSIDSLLLTPLCCDDIHDVTPRVSALAGCDMDVKEAGEKWILVKEMLMISKDGEISEFPEYHSSGEEEPIEQPIVLNKYGFVDHPKLQINEFPPHRLPQQEGNMNGWLIEDEDEPLEHEASEK
ncbi:hypothetical protein Tco_0686880 [Tanacetum coccineum]